MSNKIDPRWWVPPDSPDDPDEPWKDGWKRIMAVVRYLDEGEANVKQRMARAARLYDPAVEISGAHLDLSVGPYPLTSDRGPVTMNIVKSAIDTVTSMVAKNQPRATFMTDNADYSTTQRAKGLERFIEGEFQRTEVYDDAVRMFRDAAITGTGALKIHEDENGKASVQRVLPWELVVDDAECLAGAPRQMHELRFVDRDVLKALYPDRAVEIEMACADDKIRRWNSYRQVESELIPVVESWHLPSGPDEDDGRHAISIDGCTLRWDPWKKDYFPFVIFRWAERLTGFWGCGLSEELAGIQNKINKINWHITRCHDLTNSYVLVQSVDAALRIKASGGPEPLQLLPFRGTIKPEFVTPPAVQPELYRHLDYLIQQAYRIAGISEMSATSQKPAGLESAVALQTYNDIETQRFSIQAQRYERAILEVARQIVRLMHDIGGNDTTTNWRSGNLSKTIKWKDVKIDEDIYVMSIQAASIQSRLPSGRIQAAIELGNAGLLERDELRRLVGHPDLERSMSLANASIDHAEAIVERLTNGKYDPPEALDNLPVALKYVTQSFMILKDKEGVPEEILDNFRMWMRQALREMKTPSAPEAQAAPFAAPPPAPPGPPPPALELPPGAVA